MLITIYHRHLCCPRKKWKTEKSDVEPAHPAKNLYDKHRHLYWPKNEGRLVWGKFLLYGERSRAPWVDVTQWT